MTTPDFLSSQGFSGRHLFCAACVCCAVWIGAGKCQVEASQVISVFDSAEWGRYELWSPEGKVKGLVFLFSPKSGLAREDKKTAATLVRLGAAVALVDTGTYLARIDNAVAADECLSLPGSVEWTSNYLQHVMKIPSYQKPFLLGRECGAALVYGLLAQGEKGSFAGGLSIDFSPVLELKHPLCTCSPASMTPREQITAGTCSLCGWWRVAGTNPVAKDTAEFVRACAAAHNADALVVSGTAAADRLAQKVFEAVLFSGAAGETDGEALNASIVEVSSKSSRRILAVIYSGDGGWRDIDKALGDYLARQDIAVVGINVLRYFWKTKSPESVGRDLALMLRKYLQAWGMKKIVLVGYSFGADILPFAYNRLPGDLQQKVVMITLLAPGRTADFEVHVAAWLGKGASADAVPLLSEAEEIEKEKVQCVYGTDEADKTLCTHPVARGMEIISTAGSHHFDGNYNALGAQVLHGLLRRTGHSDP